MRPEPARPGAAAAGAVLAVLALGGCAEDEPRAPAPEPAPPAPAAEAGAPLGDWWVLSEERPYLGLRVSLEEGPDGRPAGTWTRFDWPGSEPGALRDRSVAVPCAARPHDGGWVIEGRLPEVGADGRANGLEGMLAVWLRTRASGGWQGRLIEAHDLSGDGARATITRAWREAGD